MVTMDVDSLEEQEGKAVARIQAVSATLTTTHPGLAAELRSATTALLNATHAQVRVANGRADAVIGHGLVPALTLLLIAAAMAYLVLFVPTSTSTSNTHPISNLQHAQPTHAQTTHAQPTHAQTTTLSSLWNHGKDILSLLGLPLHLTPPDSAPSNAPSNLDDANNLFDDVKTNENADDVVADADTDADGVVNADADGVVNADAREPFAWEWEGRELPIANVSHIMERIARAGETNMFAEVDVVDAATPVVVIDGFLTPAECQTLIGLAADAGLERSTVVGGMGGDSNKKEFNREASTVRTSSNAWCMSPCFDHPVVKDVSARLAAMAGVPSRDYSEHLQMLHYEEGQYYRVHHDFIPSMVSLPGSYRTITAFIYLNDVPEGGETSFPVLGIAVKPKAGRIVFWPNARGIEPRAHPNTHHEALPVIKGEKYAANAWFHAQDFQTPWRQGAAP